jgi:hypothetical protein
MALGGIEKFGEESAVAYFKVLSWFSLGGGERICSRDSQWPGRDSTRVALQDRSPSLEPTL